MKRSKSLILILCLFVIPSTITGAQNLDLRVQDAVRLAEQFSPELARFQTNIDRVAARKWDIWGLSDLDVIHAREGIPNGASGFGEQKWSVSSTLPFPLTALVEKNGVGQQIKSQEYLYNSERFRLRSTVKKAYSELLYAQEMVHLRQQEVDLASTLVNVVTGRVEVGEAAELEKMKVELQRVSSINALQQARLDFDKRRYEMFRVIGIDPEEQRYSIVFPDTMVFEEVDLTQDAVMTELRNHPIAQAGNWSEKAAESSLKASKMAFLPRLKLGYWSQDFGTGYDYHGAEIGFSINLPFVGNQKASKIRAQVNLVESKNENRAVQLDLKKAAESAWHSYETARLAVREYVDNQSELADQLLSLTREGYQLGEIDLLTVLDTQRTYLAVQAGYYAALRDYYVSVIELENLITRDLLFLEK